MATEAPSAPSSAGIASEQAAAGTGGPLTGTATAQESAPAPARAPSLPGRFHGSVRLDATRVGRDAGGIADEVISHLTGLVGSCVSVTLEIHAEVQQGVPEKVVRTVTENCRTLKFQD